MSEFEIYTPPETMERRIDLVDSYLVNASVLDIDNLPRLAAELSEIYMNDADDEIPFYDEILEYGDDYPTLHWLSNPLYAMKLGIIQKRCIARLHDLPLELSVGYFGEHEPAIAREETGLIGQKVLESLRENRLPAKTLVRNRLLTMYSDLYNDEEYFKAEKTNDLLKDLELIPSMFYGFRKGLLQEKEAFSFHDL